MTANETQSTTTTPDEKLQDNVAQPLKIKNGTPNRIKMPGPKHIYYVPKEDEPLYVAPENLISTIKWQNSRRNDIERASEYIGLVVYDSIAPSPVQFLKSSARRQHHRQSL